VVSTAALSASSACIRLPVEVPTVQRCVELRCERHIQP
jgi:hypothetical protein